MSTFVERARQIFDAAESAAAQAAARSEMTILIGQDGAIRMVTDSDWPLESLTRHHGAREGYRVSGRSGAVRVEGWAGTRACVLESVTPAAVARRLLGPGLNL